MSSDPYVYPGTTILKNIPGIRNQKTLDGFEADRVGQRPVELIEHPLSGVFDVGHLHRIHRYLFQEVWPVSPVNPNSIKKAFRRSEASVG